MFIIKKVSDNSLCVWINSRSDDFAQFLPANLKTTLSDIEIYLLPDSVENKISALEQAPKPVENAGVVSLELYESVSGEGSGNAVYTNLLETVPAQLIPYPYDENGEFVEPPEFVPN
jgi:hypothetical protein